MNHITNSLGEDGALATCPYCKKEASYYRRDYICDICGITGYNYECYACNKKEHTNNHTNAPCPDCNGTGTVREACNSDECNYVDDTTHEYVCSVCGNTQGTGAHSWSRGRCRECGATCSHIGGTHANNGTCTTCGYQYETHGKGSTVKYKDANTTTHTPYYECVNAGCTETYDEAAEAHTVATWTDNGNGTHSGTCTKCNEYVTNDHDYGADGKCKQCGSVKACEHNWVMDKDATNHWEKCTNCGETKNQEPHTIATWNDNGDGTHSGTCTKCGYTSTGDHTYGGDGKCTECGSVKACEHNWITDKDATGHWEKCTICNEIRNQEGHTITTWIDNGNGTHSGTCTKCGYTSTSDHTYGGDGKCTECGSVKTCNHNWVMDKDSTDHWEKCTECGETRNKEAHTITTWTDNGNGTHNGTCTKCGYTLTKNHEYEGNNCKDCGATKPQEECTHNWVQKNDSTNHWEECTKCGEVKNKGTHTMAAARDNGNGTHTKTCTKCNYKVTSNHSYNSSNKCKDCGVTKPATNCDHDWLNKNDDTNHWKECTKCGEIKDKEKHTVTNWKDNGDGTHSGTCDKCNRPLKGNHNKGIDGKCTDCKATISNDNNNNNSNNSNNSNNGNNTSGGKVIPNTGAGTTITIGIAATIALLGIAAVGLKKYKDIA